MEFKSISHSTSCYPTPQRLNTVQLPLQLKLIDDLTFDNFFVGQNKEAVRWLKAISEGKEQYAYVWGERGTGRTHLLQAACQWANLCNRTALYLPLAEHKAWTFQLLEDLESVQLICVDDVNLIAGESQWEEALMDLYNRLREKACGLIVSGNASSHQIPITLLDLSSRLAWGNSLQLHPLLDEEKILALQNCAKRRGFTLSTEVAEFILKRVSRNTAELFSVLDKLDEASMVAKRKLTVPFVKEVLQV